MKPVSIASSRSSASRTRCVSAWPPRRSSASKSVTWAVREATYAAVSPATPEPTTAIRCGVVVIGSLSREAEGCGDLAAGLGGFAAGVLDGDGCAVGAGRVTAEDDPVVRVRRHDPGRRHRAAVLEPEDVLLAGRGERHVLGPDRC